MTDERKTVRVQRTVRVDVLMTPSEVKAIDDWASEHGVRGRSEAIRHLVALGLKAAEDGTVAEAGASIFKLMEVSRHKSVDTLRSYVRRGRPLRKCALVARSAACPPWVRA